LKKSPNVLRVFLIETELHPVFEVDSVWCLESDMDHISGEIMGDVGGRLMLAGALDVSWCPVFMKKDVPAIASPYSCSMEKRKNSSTSFMLHTRHARHTDAAHGKDRRTAQHGNRGGFMIRQLRKNTARTKTVLLQSRNMNHWPGFGQTGGPSWN